MNKTELLNEVAAESGVDKRDVAAVLAGFETVATKRLRKGEAVSIPGFIKLSRKDTPARKAKKNVPNPFKPGSTYDQKARPASKSAKATTLKRFKDAVGGKR